MTYAPTGGLVAAPTAGLPEQIGGERNWDYRYTWVRDASFSVYALLRLGLHRGGGAFGRWLRRPGGGNGVGGDGGPLNIMYRVDGSSDLKEESLEHWEGYRGSRPVRIGNGAADQLQLDIYGEALDSIYFADQRGLQVGHRGWVGDPRAARLAGRQLGPARGGHLGDPRRAQGLHLRPADVLGGVRPRRSGWRPRTAVPPPSARWTEARDAIYDQIMEQGLEPAARRRSSSTTAADVLDSSLLRMPSVGFIAPAGSDVDLDAARRWTTSWSPTASSTGTTPRRRPTGCSGSEGTFSLCTFIYVDALARAGRLDEARLTFEKMLTYANHVGLFSEEIALTGEQIGNFPQAFTHLALIDAAITLDEALNTAGPR